MSFQALIAAAEWDESEHPRDEKGEFTSGGGSAVGATHVAAVKLYQKDQSAINAPLRQGTLDDFDMKDSKAVVEALDSLIASQPPLESATTLYRGLDRSGYEKLVGTVGVGGVFSDPAFASTSLKASVAKEFIGFYGNYGAVLKIEAGAGQRGLNVNAFHKGQGTRSGNAREHEFLLPRGARFEITKIGTVKVDDEPVRLVVVKIV